MKPLSPTRRGFVAGGLAAATLAGPALSAAPGAWRQARPCFIDPAGDDGADGLTPRSAWRSLAPLASLDPADDHDIRLIRGGIWSGGLTLPGGQTRITAYGEGPLPRLACGMTLAPVRLPGPVPGATLWEAAVAHRPRQVLADGRHLQEVEAPEAIDGPGLWSWSGGRAVLAVPGDATPELVAVDVARGIDGRACRLLSVSDVSVAHAVCGIDVDDTEECEIARAALIGCYVNGIRASSARPRRHLSIEGTAIAHTAGTAIAFGGRIDAVRIAQNTIRGAGLLGEAAGEPSLAWTAGIKNWGWASPGWQGHVAIVGNEILHSGPRHTDRPRAEHGHGIWIDEVVEPQQRHLVAFNRVSDCASRGIYVEKSDAVDVDYNAVWRCGTTAGTGALALQANQYGYDVVADRPATVSGRCRGNRLRHNTAVGAGLALEVVCTDPGCDLSHNLVEDNILVGWDGARVTGAQVLCLGGGANDGRHGRGNAYGGNCLGPEDGRQVTWGRRRTGSLARLARISDQAFPDSLGADPKLRDTAAGDLSLRPDSPCRDRADTAPHPHDIDGHPVPQGRMADVGCHELATDGLFSTGHGR